MSEGGQGKGAYLSEVEERVYRVVKVSRRLVIARESSQRSANEGHDGVQKVGGKSSTRSVTFHQSELITTLDSYPLTHYKVACCVVRLCVLG